jgi:hypothetical protein
LKELDPEKLSVTFVPPVTETNPIRFRKYTLTHSDTTGNLFLTIGPYFDFDKINPITRDEVLAQWGLVNPGIYTLQAFVYVGNSNFNMAKTRYDVFKRELPLALEALIYGDREFFKVHPELLGTPITVRFISSFPQFNRTEFYNRPIDYLI